MGQKHKIGYSHYREGETLKVEIKDGTRRLIYKNKININDKSALLDVLSVIENYSGFSIVRIIKEKLDSGKWW